MDQVDISEIMSSAEQLQLLNDSTNTKGKMKHDVLTAKRRQQRMRNLNMTYTKSRKRRKSVPKNNNSKSKIAAGNILVKADESSSQLVETVVYRCPYCTFWHRTLDGFHGHMSKNHEHGTQMYQCTYCHLTADTHDELLSHINQLSKTDSSHKRATCLFLSKNLVERYAAYLKTTQVPSSANFGQLSLNSVEVKQSGKNNNYVKPSDIMNLSQESANSSTVQDEEDLLYFSDSPISTFPEISLSSPVSDGSVLDSPRAQFGTVLSTADCSEKGDPLEPSSKKMRLEKQLNNNVIISNNPEMDSNYSVISGNNRTLKNAMEFGSKKCVLHPANKENPISSNEKMLQYKQSKNRNSSSANLSPLYSESDDSDSDACIPTSCSEYSDWLTDRGATLEPPKLMKRKLSKPQLHSRIAAIPKIFRPSLSSVVPRRLPFYPQMGDEVIYFRQGHELYLDTVKQKKLFKINPRSLPWYTQLIHEQELVKIISINYEIKPQIRLYCLKLGLIDPNTRSLTGETFSLKYHDVEGVLDFLVLQQDFDLAVQRTWQPGDRFRSLINDGYGVQMWWEGQILQREPFNKQYPNSMFLCYRIRWDNHEVDLASPWDLEKVDSERRPSRPGASVPVLPNEIASMLYKPRAEDWPPVGDRDSECDRISAGFSKVMDMYVAKHFAAPVKLELYPTYASIVKYPMDLSTIKARLVNRFYRRVTSVQYDVRRIHINAFRFNLPKSDIVRNSSIISELCLEIIRNRDSDDVKSMYREIVEKYRILDEKEEEKALELSRIANTQRGKSLDNIKTKNQNNTPAATAAPNWRQQCKDLFEMINEDAASCRGLLSIPKEQSCSQAVDQQVDLQTVREKLRLSSYLTPMDFANDVRLILNYYKNYYTEKESPNLAIIVRLSAVFEENYSKILATLKPPKNSARKSMNSSSKDAVSRKGKSLAPPSSTNDISRSVDNSKKNVKLIPNCLSKEETANNPNSSPQPTGDEQLFVPSQSAIPTVDCVINLDPEIPGAVSTDSIAAIVLQDKTFLQDKAPLLNEKDQLNVDIENGFRKLGLIESELKKDMQLLSEQQKKIDVHYANLLQRREAADKPDSESDSQILKLTCLTELREKINRQLLLCTKEKLTQELTWREHQAIALKLELGLNLIDPNESPLEFRTTEKILAEKRREEKLSGNRLNSIRDEITSLEQEQKNLDCKISDLKAMHGKLDEMKATKTTMEAQILMKKSKKSDVLCDLSKWISAWKAMEMKLIQILYQEALGDIEKMANERYNKLEQLVKCAQNLSGSSSKQLL